MEWLDRLFVFMELTFINLLLSGDNAVVIAMAARRLPQDKRNLAIWWGTAAAVLLRCALTFGAVLLLDIPFLQSAGAIMLLLIALKLALDRGDQHISAAPSSSLAGAVWTIVVADFVMSLDNVIAVAAIAEQDIALLVVGIAMGIPIIIWGSSFIMRLLDKAPWLTIAGGMLLAYTAGKMMLHDEGLERMLPQLSSSNKQALPYIAVAVLLSAVLWIRRKRTQ